MASFSRHLANATPGFGAEMGAVLSLPAGVLVGAAVGLRFAWDSGALAVMGGLTGGALAGLVLGCGLAAAFIAVPMVLAAGFNYAADCFESVDRAFCPRWLRLPRPTNSNLTDYPVWAIPFLVALCGLPLGVMLWAGDAVLRLQAGRPLSSLPGAVGSTVLVLLVVGMLLATGVAAYAFYSASPRLAERLDHWQRRSRLARALLTTLLLTPLVLVALTMSRLLDFLMNPERFHRFTWRFDAAVTLALLVVFFLAGLYEGNEKKKSSNDSSNSA